MDYYENWRYRHTLYKIKGIIPTGFMLGFLNNDNNQPAEWNLMTFWYFGVDKTQ